MKRGERRSKSARLSLDFAEFQNMPRSLSGETMRETAGVS